MLRTLNQLRTSPTRKARYLRRSAYVGLSVGSIYTLDRTYNASAITRNCRTFWTCALVTLDYKLNFSAEKSELIPELHERVAERVYNLFTSNGGLYIKFGQAIGANPGILPRPMQVKFARLFDDAPQIPFSDVLSVFQSEFGRSPSGPEGMFEEFDENAVASASIAQVHKAKLWEKDAHGKDQWVAVKIQKPAVAKQVEWDLAGYRAVMWMFENWAFNLPVYFVVDFVSDHLRRELDFVEEANNAMRTAELVSSEPSLSGRVYVPKVFPDLSTKKVMTAEWIDGVRLSDRVSLFRLMGERDPKSKSNSSTEGSRPTPSGGRETFKPLKGGVSYIMQTMVELFSAQMFSWGWVHCDPHPGNIIIRSNPSNPRYPQLVLLDHGLYVQLSEDFRRQYAKLWKGLLATDLRVVENVTKEWGIGTPDLFASATLMRPVKLGAGEGNDGVDINKEMTQYERSVEMKKLLKRFLTDTDKMPKALIFLGRNIRIVQGNNQSLGSPVNRIKITGTWASRSLTRTPNLTTGQRLREYWYYALFQSVMLSLDVAFWLSRTRQFVSSLFGLGDRMGFEDELEKSMRMFAKTSLGVEINSGIFEG